MDFYIHLDGNGLGALIAIGIFAIAYQLIKKS